MLLQLTGRWSDTVFDTLKWTVPLAFSGLALWRTVNDASRTARENSSRARQQYNADLRSWCNEAIATMGNAILVVEGSELDRKELAGIGSRLSVLADQGRLFFPNLHTDLHGQEKEVASRGFRPRILDWLIYGIDACRHVDRACDSEMREVLVSLKRGLTGDCQLAIEPRNLFTTMENLQELLLRGDFMEISQAHPNLIAAFKVTSARKERRCGAASDS